MKPTISTNPDNTPVILITPDPIPYTLDEVNQHIDAIAKQVAMFQSGIDEKNVELATWQGYRDQLTAASVQPIDPQPLPVQQVGV